MSTIKDVLLDAEEKQARNKELRSWLRQLQDVVLNAEDLLVMKSRRDYVSFADLCTVHHHRHLGDEKQKNTVDLQMVPSDDHQVGFEGLGNTTLANLVYNDERVVRNFELRMWQHISYQMERVTKFVDRGQQGLILFVIKEQSLMADMVHPSFCKSALTPHIKQISSEANEPRLFNEYGC
ncbi:disease resistance protein RGA1 [Pyrus ussuriensis x Pyrus communis]|uniref:Disease resistance protein RGA1 n=1 Tax=Pyrus ussuriensis x Pyrus communis TaxID=2448454 RepID=A0A5N5I0T5_9ROSA|nr:disease resistance protein RGA1 [Pyrus ussuriensis x Pyrus communis]